MNKNQKYLVVFGIFALVIVTTAASFAFFSYSRVGNTTTTITSGDIEFTYKEGDSATLANAFPVSDVVGANDTSEEYTFTVNLKSSSASNKMNYNVYLLDTNDDENVNYFTNDQIKFALVKDGTFVAGTSSTSGIKLSNINGFNTGEHTGEGLVLEDQEIISGKTDEYKLRIWISDDVNYSNTDKIDDGTDDENDDKISIGKFNGYKYSLKVKVTSEMGNSIVINDLNVRNKTITAELSDINGLSAYAVTTSTIAPANDSIEWIEITNETAKNNVKRTTDNLITSKSISYTVNENGTYYLHVRNKLNQISKKQFVINVITYKDESGANVPVIKTGMIPVTYDGTNWVKADTADVWYDYDQQWWANAVTVSEVNRDTYINAKAGTPISMSDINTMWVWIPRYEYETITSTTATEIKVNFLKGTESNKTANYITHPAFTFGDDELTGIWVAKFEASSDSECIVEIGAVNRYCDVTDLKVNIKPNVTSWQGIRISTADLNTRAMNDVGNTYGFLESEVDTHVMKNIEWGVVAYLSQSKYGKYGNENYEGSNKEIYANESSSYITGMSNGRPSSDIIITQVTYDIEGTGTGASTTGNIYGIYDMVGGSWEHIMGVIKDNSSGKPMSGSLGMRNGVARNSGFSGKLYESGQYIDLVGRDWPDAKYYDLYEFGTTKYDNAAYARAKTGDATTETKNWYSDGVIFAFSEEPWIMRSKSFVGAGNGIFASTTGNGMAGHGYSFRPVLVEQ